MHVGRDDWHRSPQTNNGAEIEIVLPKAERAGEAGIPTKPKPETRTKPSGKMGETRNPGAAEKRNPKPKPGQNRAGAEPLRLRATLTLQGHYRVATGDLEYDGEGEPAAVRQREHKMEVLV